MTHPTPSKHTSALTDPYSPEQLRDLAISASYVDAFGATRTIGDRTRALLTSRFERTAGAADVIVATPGRHHPRLHGTLVREDGTSGRVDGYVDVAGYHHLTTDAGIRHLVLAAEEYLPQPPRTFGLAVQLYAARTRDSWGIGDYRDLATIARRAAADGAGMVLISPIHAMAPVLPAPNSPYSPASRLWLNTLHIAPGDAPGAERVDLSDLAAAGRALNRSRRIDRDAVSRLKTQALERIWAVVCDDEPAEFTAWAAAHGTDLDTFATWCVLAETYGPNWRTWPPPLRHPATAEVVAFAAEHADRVRFHAWCQWVADRQLATACSSGVAVCVDAAVGFDSSSADGWVYQDTLAFDFEVGCPPDRHNIEGQRWGLPPFDPHALTGTDFAPFVKMVRASLRHAGGLRIDHVMQLWRLFWIPVAGTAHEGAYVHYPVDALLAILRIEAVRAGAWIVGEDMGTVADGVRETMADIGMLGYRAAIRTDPAENPECSMGASATHDQATVAGTLTGSDMADMASIGKAYDPEHLEHTRRDLAARAGLDPDQPAGAEEVVAAVLAQHRMLAASPSRIVVATLDDTAGVTERPNMPGTVDAWPNWRIALPAPVEDLLAAPLARALFDVLRVGR